jgi:hypothetical protein
MWNVFLIVLWKERLLGCPEYGLDSKPELLAKLVNVSLLYMHSSLSTLAMFRMAENVNRANNIWHHL